MNARADGGRIPLWLNGNREEVRAGTTIADLAPAELGAAVAVARNREVVPRAQWQRTVVAPEDEIEIVRPIQGG